jgi:hypothetical protein
MAPKTAPAISPGDVRLATDSELDIGDPIDFAMKLADGFAKGERGYRDNRRKFLQHVYRLVWQIEGDDAFLNRFKQFAFWKTAMQKPNAKNLVRSMLFFTMGAISEQDRLAAGRAAKVLRAFLANGVDPDSVAELLEELGGTEPICDRLRNLARAGAILPNGGVADPTDSETTSLDDDAVNGQRPRSGDLAASTSIDLRVDAFRHLIKGPKGVARADQDRFSIAKRMDPDGGAFIDLSEEMVTRLRGVGRDGYHPSGGYIHFTVHPRERSDFLPIEATRLTFE